MDKNIAMLSAVHSALKLNQSDVLEADLVNEMAWSLGLVADDVARLVEKWQSEGLINLHWGPKLSLTEKGIEMATGGSPSRALYIGGSVGNNVTMVAGSVGSSAVVGNQAMGAGAMKYEVSNHIGDLVAALTSLSQINNQLNPDERETAKALVDEIQDVVQETNKAEPDKASLGERLDRANDLMEKLGKTSDAAIKLKPILISLGAGIAWLAKTYLGI